MLDHEDTFEPRFLSFCLTIKAIFFFQKLVPWCWLLCVWGSKPLLGYVNTTGIHFCEFLSGWGSRS